MEDMYVKPGNQERGWNDPPQLSYNLQKARGQQKGHLTRRAAPPPCPGVPPSTPPASNPLAPPPSSLAPPPRCQVGPPTATALPVSGGHEEPSSQSQREPDVEEVMSSLTQALASCRRSVKSQVCNDMEKRLLLLDDSWRSGRLSLPVRRRMETLSRELRCGHWDSANEIHRSLMVDHVTEVSQWMVGVKRLIAETRNLDPDVLKELETSEPDQDQNS